MADSDKYKTRADGQLVVKALEHLNAPSTLANIIEWIIGRTSGDPVELIHSVRRTLSKGLSLGFVDTLQRRYFLSSNQSWHDYDSSMTFASTTKRHLEAEPTPPPPQSIVVDEPEGAGGGEPSAKRPRQRVVLNYESAGFPRKLKKLQRKRKR